MINLVFHGLAVPAVADISPENKIFHNPNLKDYDYDPKLAAGMLEAAGYHLVKPGVRTDPKGNRLEFDLTTNTGTPERNEMCTIFKQDVESLGIKVNYRPLEFTTLVDKLDSSFDWDCVLIGFTGGIEPNDGANFYRSSGNLHLWNPNQPTPATPWEAEIDHSPRPGRFRDGSQPSARLTTGRFSKSCTTSCRYSKPCASSAIRRGRTRWKTISPRCGARTSRSGCNSRPTEHPPSTLQRSG